MSGRVRRRRTTRTSQSGALTRRFATLVVVVVLAVGAGVGAGLVMHGRGGSAATQTPGVPPPTGPGLSLQPSPPAPAVLVAVSGRPVVSIARLKARLVTSVLPGLGADAGFAVSQLGNQAASWHTGAVNVTPASTMKLLTTTAALATLGPAHRFVTSVVQGSGPGSVILVGGGDPLLVAARPTHQQSRSLYPRPASLQELATRTATRLAQHGVRRVRLGYDASLFTGPAVNPHWPSSYVPDDVVSPISALWVNEGREEPGLEQRSADPAAAAAGAFSALLVKAGVTVTGPVEARVPPKPRSGRVLASVASAPLQQIVQHVLEVSDNEGAEVLLRQVAVATGRPGSFVAGVAAVRTALARLGLDLRGAVFFDGSGLSPDDVLPVQLLLHVLLTAASPAHPVLRGVVTGLPVAGFTGSLSDRFVDDAQQGLGYVRAKTGTLTGVDGLAGIVLTRRGQALAFVAVANRVADDQTLGARVRLDQVAAALASCGC